MRLIGARRDEGRAAERREEVEQRFFVGEVDHAKRSRTFASSERPWEPLKNPDRQNAPELRRVLAADRRCRSRVSLLRPRESACSHPRQAYRYLPKTHRAEVSSRCGAAPAHHAVSTVVPAVVNIIRAVLGHRPRRLLQGLEANIHRRIPCVNRTGSAPVQLDCSASRQSAV
jgi:hypothetical protein